MANRLTLEIVTPERLLLKQEADEITVPGLGGELGILPGHTPLISQLAIAGLVSYRNGSEQGFAVVSQGFVEVMPDKVTVLAERAEKPEEIDLAKAKTALQEAERTLKSAEKDPTVDVALALAELDSAMVRVQAAERFGRR
ncbi:MAG: F0F1 ATP synthase subunit epsilon [Blastocatellia bacterium]|nr:F0F1 ATP synthase subunit epsilon [Blastocatellia bacterium]